MPEGHVSVVTQKSWFSRLGDSIKGIVGGVVLVGVSFPLLFWNEGRAVQTAKTLKEGAGAVVSVASDVVSPDNEGRLIHVMGRAETAETLTDSDFGLSIQALKLQRSTEMYQWKENSRSETRNKLGGGTETVTTYSYEKDWSDSLIDSSRFKEPAGRANPGSMPYPSAEHVVKTATLGAFRLSPSLIGMMDAYEAWPVPEDYVLPAALQEKARVHGAGIYLGADPAAPQVGDARIRFEVVNPAPVSVIARQLGDTFEPYRAKAGGAIELLFAGEHSAESMIAQAQQSNKMLTWVLRLVGFVLMLSGFNMIFKLLSVVADVLPILGRIVGVGTGLVALLLAAVLSLLTIAVAWLFYRPVAGILLIAAAVGLAVALRTKMKAAKTPA